MSSYFSRFYHYLQNPATAARHEADRESLKSASEGFGREYYFRRKSASYAVNGARLFTALSKCREGEYTNLIKGAAHLCKGV